MMLMELKYSILFFILVVWNSFLAFSAPTTNLDREFSFAIEHSFTNPSEWKPRGTVSFKRESKREALLMNDTLQNATIVGSNRLTGSDLTSFKSLVEKNGFYQIRVSISNANDLFVSSSVRACSLVSSHFLDTLTLNLDPTGNLVGIDCLLPLSQCEGNKFDLTDINTINWNTSVLINFGVEAKGVKELSPAPPPTPPPISPDGTTPPAEEKQEGFFQKYWYFIVPLGIMMLINSLMGAAPDQAGQGQQARQRRG